MSLAVIFPIMLFIVLMFFFCIVVIANKYMAIEMKKVVSYLILGTSYIYLFSRIHLLATLFTFARETPSINLSLLASADSELWINMGLSIRVAQILGSVFWLNMNWLVLALLTMLSVILSYKVFKNIELSKSINYLIFFTILITTFIQVSSFINIFLFTDATNIFPGSELSTLIGLLAFLVFSLLIVASAYTMINSIKYRKRLYSKV